MSVRILQFGGRVIIVYIVSTMARIIKSRRGRPLLVLNNYTFSKVQRALVRGEIKWRCTNWKCNAFLKTFGTDHMFIEMNDFHDHYDLLTDKIRKEILLSTRN